MVVPLEAMVIVGVVVWAEVMLGFAEIEVGTAMATGVAMVLGAVVVMF